MFAICMVLFLGLVLPVSAQSPEGPTSFPDEQGLPGLFETHSSRPMKAGMIILGTGSRLNRGTSMIEEGRIRGPDADIAVEEAFIASFRSFLAAGLGYGFDLALVMPFYYEYLPGAQDPPDSWAPGDASGLLKVRLPLDIPFASLSVFGFASAPTSAAGGPLLPKQLAYHPFHNRLPDGVSHAAGMAEPRAGLGLGVSFDLSDAGAGPMVALHMNVSGDRTLAEAASNPLGILAASTALEAHLAKGLRLESELRHQRLVSDMGALGSPVGRSTTLGAGLGWLTGTGLSVRIGAVAAPSAWNRYLPMTMVSDAGEERELAYRLQPFLSAYLQLAWQGFPLGRDGDHDGIPDGEDGCPSMPEDRDGVQDADGCPDRDNDGDGVPDPTDNCPYAAEDHDGFEDGDGCPEPDNDRDGSLDSSDQCPYDPEDRDGYLDQDGCPDLDDDKDGIPDAADKCPREPENRNGVEDEDGCPDRDTDGDRIPDPLDKCPREKEIVNFFQDEDGCPDEKPEPIRNGILAGVEFRAGSSELLSVSYPVLDSLADRLLAYPGTEIEIQGHLDDRAGPRAKAMSLERAQTVADYLVNRDIEPRRLKTSGLGSTRPIAPNRTAQGRAKNRRIEIHRLN